MANAIAGKQAQRTTLTTKYYDKYINLIILIFQPVKIRRKRNELDWLAFTLNTMPICHYAAPFLPIIYNIRKNHRCNAVGVCSMPFKLRITNTYMNFVRQIIFK